MGRGASFMSIPVPKSGPFACEDVSRPVRIAEPSGTFREQPVAYRCKGLVVTNSTAHTAGPHWDARWENGWHSDEMWSVTHEATGTRLCCWESGLAAVCAAQALLALPVDWRGDNEAVRLAVAADPHSMATISTLRAGMMVMVERSSGAQEDA